MPELQPQQFSLKRSRGQSKPRNPPPTPSRSVADRHQHDRNRECDEGATASQRQPLAVCSSGDLSSSRNWGTEGGGGEAVSGVLSPEKKKNIPAPPQTALCQTLGACSTSRHLVDFAAVSLYLCVYLYGGGGGGNLHLDSERGMTLQRGLELKGQCSVTGDDSFITVKLQQHLTLWLCREAC